MLLFSVSGTVLRAVGIHRILRQLSAGSEYILMYREFTEGAPLCLANGRLNLEVDRGGEW